MNSVAHCFSQSSRSRLMLQIFLGYTIAVILWGAWVRISNSGAGCGDHWPLCQGAVVPLGHGGRTWVEFGHRLMTGLFGIAVMAIAVWHWRPLRGSSIGRSSIVALLLATLSEVLIGRFLVVRGLVEDDDSLARIAVAALHLGNTYVLIAAVVGILFAVSCGAGAIRFVRRPSVAALLAITALLIAGMTGAIAAVANTLYPSLSLAQGIRDDLSSAAPLAVQLRIFHPLLAAIAAAVTWKYAAGAPQAARHHKVLLILLGVQLLLGVLAILLAAPLALKLAHLAVSDLLWCALIYSVLIESTAPHAPALPLERNRG